MSYPFFMAGNTSTTEAQVIFQIHKRFVKEDCFTENFANTLSMKKTGTHVVINPKGEWSVKRSGATRSMRNFETQGEAIRFARKTAKREAGELYIHGRNGRIRARNSYGSDPFPPKG